MPRTSYMHPGKASAGQATGACPKRMDVVVFPLGNSKLKRQCTASVRTSARGIDELHFETNGKPWVRFTMPGLRAICLRGPASSWPYLVKCTFPDEDPEEIHCFHIALDSRAEREEFARMTGFDLTPRTTWEVYYGRGIIGDRLHTRILERFRLLEACMQQRPQE